MLPDNTASSIGFGGLYYSPDDLVTTPLVDYESGGLVLNDSSAGLFAAKWKAWYDGTQVWVQSEIGEPILLFEELFITEITLCFDQNMRWSIGYVAQGVMKLNWYDTYLNARVQTVIPGEANYNPKMCLDDKRAMSIQTSDMIFAYLRGNSLYYRQQRDRFQVEYFLRDGLFPGTKLKNIGMNKNMRLQFELV